MNDTIQRLLGAVNNGLSVIKKVADIGGPVVPYASTVSGAVGLIQQLIAAGQDIEPEVSAIVGTFTNPDVIPTQSELDSLDAVIAAARAKLHAPLPPAEPGEPE